MPREINRKRLNYMNACVKYYDDGSEILQSYSTDVVKKTPDGKYIRLWHCWSPATMKQVKAYCGQYFRGLPYEDGTYEDTRREYKRVGVDLIGLVRSYTPSECAAAARMIANDISNGKETVFRYYKTCYDKDLREIYKGNKKMIELLNVLYSCAKRKIRGNSAANTLIKIYDFDFVKVWKEGGLCKLYPDIKL